MSATGAAAGPVPKDAQAVTFVRDVLPILKRECMSCHQPGQIAPMSFTNYEETRPWAESIREAVVRRDMPPWNADPN